MYAPKRFRSGANTIGFDDAEFYTGSPDVPSPLRMEVSRIRPTPTCGSVRLTAAGPGEPRELGGPHEHWARGPGWLPAAPGGVPDVAATGGTYTLSLWLLKQAGARATNMQLFLNV